MIDTLLAFALPPELTADGLKSRLAAYVALQMRPPQPIERIYYDTFDWRLAKAGLALEQDLSGARASWRLYELATGDDVALLDAPTNSPFPGDGYAPFFSDALPPGELATVIKPLAAIRALLPLAHVAGTVTMLRVFNKDVKTVARVAVEDTHLVGSQTPLPTVARLLPVRGYDRRLDEVRLLMASMPDLQPSPNDPMVFATEAAGHVPGDYSSGLRIVLDPAERADEATRTIYRTLFEAMQRNEPGVRGDIDSEFLHDFRVSVRRTRSALSQITGVLPEAQVEHFKTEFGWLGQMTGPTRDLDVYLLQFDDFRADLPEYMRDRLDPLRDHLLHRQREEQAGLVRALDTTRYAKLRREWPRFLNKPTPARDTPENAAVPVGELASRQILRAYHRVVRQAAAVTADSPAEDVHEVRKSAKKLRYLLEFYSSLYPAEDLKTLVVELRQVQDILGEYQDLQVQIESLEGYAAEMQAAGDVPAATLMAIGALTGQLYSRELEVRQELMPILSRFTRPKLRRRFEATFDPPPPHSPDDDEPKDAESQPSTETENA